MLSGKRKYFLLLASIVLVFLTFIYLNMSGYFITAQDITDTLEAYDSSATNAPATEVALLNAKYPNLDIVGLIRIPGTDLNEVVVQGTDNDYYLNHDMFKSQNRAGATFLDYRITDESRKKIIYSHNSDTLDVPFKELENYYDYEYYLEHPLIEYVDDTKTTRYKIFSVFIETSDWSYVNLNFTSNEEYLEHINKLKEKSLYDTGITLSETDNILILQTCSHHKDYAGYPNKYLLVIAREI